MYTYYRLKQGILFTGDILLIIIATRLTPFIRFGFFRDIFQRHTGASAITLFLYLSFFYIFDLYNIARNREKDIWLRNLLAVICASGPIALFFFILPQWKYGRGIWFIQISLVFLLTFLWRKGFSYLLKLHSPTNKNVLLIGAGKAGEFFSQWIKDTLQPFSIVGFIDDDPVKVNNTINGLEVLGTSDQLFQIAEAKEVKTAFIAIKHNIKAKLVKNLLSAKLKGWEIRNIIKDFEESTGRVPVEFIKDEWLLYTGSFYILNKILIQRVKRLMDIIFSCLLLILFSPLMVTIGVAIWVESGFPVIFRQLRVGKDDVLFGLWKFRSMRYNAEENGAIWAKEMDPRVTRVGRIIRFLRLDELPQLINVLRGEMSLIGPRPERPEFVIELEKQIPYYVIRHTVRPGITGWAQINYPYGSSVKDAFNKLEFDLYYIKNMSPLLEIQIFLKTIGIMFFGQGAR